MFDNHPDVRDPSHQKLQSLSAGRAISTPGIREEAHLD